VTRSKRDGNEAPILQALHALGVWSRQLPRDAGFDLLLCWRGAAWIVEIKDGARPPSERRLTPAEQRTRAELEAIGVTYHVCTSLAEVLAVLGAV
jgi:hypothetical protein